MKLFLAWSGPASQQLAGFMHEWLQSVIQAVEPFMSSKDIRQGQRWASEIGAKLAEIQFALLCLTPTNLESRWIHFEAGAVSKTMDEARVSALLFDVTPTQIEFPLQQFQHTPLTRDGLWKLVQDINKLCTPPLQDSVLQKSFERAFPEVETELAKIRKTTEQEQRGGKAPGRTTDEVLTDLLATQQGLAASFESLRKDFQQTLPTRFTRAARPLPQSLLDTLQTDLTRFWETPANGAPADTSELSGVGRIDTTDADGVRTITRAAASEKLRGKGKKRGA